MDLADSVTIARRPADLIDADLAEVDVAISLVAGGAARRVRSVGLRWAEIDSSDGSRARPAKAVAFRVDRTTGAAALIFAERPTGGLPKNRQTAGGRRVRVDRPR